MRIYGSKVANVLFLPAQRSPALDHHSVFSGGTRLGYSCTGRRACAETIVCKPMHSNTLYCGFQCCFIQNAQLNTLLAPMPGVVKAIDCEVDEQVEEGTALVTLEAMKMQNPLFSPKSGKVRSYKHHACVHQLRVVCCCFHR